MNRSKYTARRMICTMGDFEHCENKWYRVRFGFKWKTLHRAFLISWQYRTLCNFIYHGCVWEAVLKEDVLKELENESRQSD